MFEINFSATRLRRYLKFKINKFTRLLFICIILVGFNRNTNAQLKIGAFGSLDRSYINKIDESGYSFSHHNSWAAGLSLCIQYEKFSVENKFSYTKIGIQFAPGYFEPTSISANLNTSFLFKYNVFRKFKLILGPSLYYNIKDITSNTFVTNSKYRFGILSGLEYSLLGKVSIVMQHNWNLAFHDTVIVGVPIGQGFSSYTTEQRRLRLNMISIGLSFYPFINEKVFGEL